MFVPWISTTRWRSSPRGTRASTTADAPGLREVVGEELAQPRAVVEGDEFLEMLADEVLGLEAEDALRRRRHVADTCRPASRSRSRRRCCGSSALKRASAERVARPVWTATDSAVTIAWRANRRPAAMHTTQAISPAGSPKLPSCRIEQCVAGEHQGRVGRERRERRAALGRVHRRRAALGCAGNRGAPRPRRPRSRRDAAARRMADGVPAAAACASSRREPTSAPSASAKATSPGQPCQSERRSSRIRGKHADHGVEADGP